LPLNSLRFEPKHTAVPASALACLMIEGSDARLHLNHKSYMNGYGCQPWPRSQEISFSSSTASTISQQAYAAADAAFLNLCDFGSPSALAHAFERHVEKVRQDIKELLELDTGAEVILSPSGTDSELHALFLARCALEKPIMSVIVAADETGSGVSLAASGRHFDSMTSGGRLVVKGKPIAGLATEPMSIPVAARSRNGDARLMSEIDEDVRRCVTRAIDGGFGVALHIMDHSKTGARYPSRECLREIVSTYEGSVQIVVDACQARLSRSRLSWYLDQQYMILITGSKFFTGPPLSGALLVPKNLSARMALVRNDPEGLTDYTSQYDWPRTWLAVRSKLPARMNFGQLLRWIAAIDEMRAYFAIPELVRRIALRESAVVISRSIDRYPNVQLLPTVDPSSTHAEDFDEFETRTIFPFLVMRGHRPFSFSESRTLYRALNEDISDLLRAQGITAESELASRLCHIGQPVAVPDGAGGLAGALRLSVDARMVSRYWSSSRKLLAADKAARPFDQVRIVLDKLQLLSEHFSKIESAFALS
jgi:hypothetical protein